MTQEEREIEIEHAIDILCDIVPYDTPNYWTVVREMAECYVDHMDSIDDYITEMDN